MPHAVHCPTWLFPVGSRTQRPIPFPHKDEKPPFVMMVTSARLVRRYEVAGLVGGMGGVQKDRGNNLCFGLRDVGYCFGTECADCSGNRSHDDDDD
jgi:hypothetical protein